MTLAQEKLFETNASIHNRIRTSSAAYRITEIDGLEDKPELPEKDDPGYDAAKTSLDEYSEKKRVIDFYTSFISGNVQNASLVYSNVVGWLAKNGKITLKYEELGGFDFNACISDEDIDSGVIATWEFV